MTKHDEIKAAKAEPVSGLALLREPFPANQISKLPKPTKKQTDEVRNDFKKGIRCKVCGGWHHPNVVHLDYVGHAALTHRLLDCDPLWNWEPVATHESGTPQLDNDGGMWIRLTVCGVTRLGYGHSDGKRGGDAVKEVIGDALRNAAMRFGAALDLWHKGDLHAENDGSEDPDHASPNPDKAPSTPITEKQFQTLKDMIARAGLLEDDVCRAENVKSLHDLTGQQYQRAVEKLKFNIRERESAQQPNSNQAGPNNYTDAASVYGATQ